uniref:transposase n=1 Tax=Candidatus Enterovibrio escicola TaxID=1927127 RepID=UPI0012383D5A|nr:transposase [Candidatus Enterovibrio escacola]
MYGRCIFGEISATSFSYKGVSIIKNTWKYMKSKVMKLWDRLMTRKQFIRKIVFDKMKNISQIENSRQ